MCCLWGLGWCRISWFTSDTNTKPWCSCLWWHYISQLLCPATLYPITCCTAHWAISHTLWYVLMLMCKQWFTSGNRKLRYSIRRPRKLYPRTKHEVDRMTRCRDMAIQIFPRCKAGHWLVVNVYTLMSCTPLRYVRNISQEE